MECNCYLNPMETCGDLAGMGSVCVCADYGLIAQDSRTFPS